jgi:hypothetical protein
MEGKESQESKAYVYRGRTPKGIIVGNFNNR